MIFQILGALKPLRILRPTGTLKRSVLHQFSSYDKKRCGRRDAFGKDDCNYTDLRYEQASVLYNIAALHSTLAVKERRVDAECASWVLQNITEKYLPLEDSADLRIDIIRALQFILMCQAQECVVEKSLLDNRPANITAKLAQHLAESYDQLANDLSKPAVIATLPPKFQKEWHRRCQVKAAYYAGLADYHQGLSEELAEEYGVSIAWFQKAEKQAAEAHRLSKSVKDPGDLAFPVSVSSPLRTNTETLVAVVQRKLTGAVKDNELIYNKTIPPAESLELIKATCLVKGIQFDPCDPEIRGPDIFQRLVPMKTLEAASIYSERKANLLRTLTSEVDEKDAAIHQFMTGIDLNPALMSTPDPALGQEFYDLCAQIGGAEQPPEKQLSTKMQELAHVSADKDEAVHQFSEKVEAAKVRVNSLSAFRSELVSSGGITSGDLGGLISKVTKCRTSLQSVSDRYQSLLATVVQAGQSNVQLRQVIVDNVEMLNRLTIAPDDLAASLPSVNQLIQDPSTKETLNETTRLLGKVGEMQQQRNDLVNQLRKSLHNDDVTADLLTLDQLESSSLEQLFEARLAKNHDSLVSLIRLNLSAQDNIESALMELNATFAPKAVELRRTREKRLEQLNALVSSGRAFEELMRKCDEGLAFYAQIDARLAELNQELDDIDSTVNEALEEQESKMKLQIQQYQQQQQQQQQKLQQQRQTAMLATTSGPGARPPPATLGEYMASFHPRPAQPQSTFPPPHMMFRPPTFGSPTGNFAQPPGPFRQPMTINQVSSAHQPPATTGQQQQQQHHPPITTPGGTTLAGVFHPPFISTAGPVAGGQPYQYNQPTTTAQQQQHHPPITSPGGTTLVGVFPPPFISTAGPVAGGQPYQYNQPTTTAQQQQHHPPITTPGGTTLAGVFPRPSFLQLGLLREANLTSTTNTTTAQQQQHHPPITTPGGTTLAGVFPPPFISTAGPVAGGQPYQYNQPTTTAQQQQHHPPITSPGGTTLAGVFPPPFISTAGPVAGGQPYHHHHQQQFFPAPNQQVRPSPTTTGAVSTPGLQPITTSAPPSQPLGPATAGPVPTTSVPNFRPPGPVNYGQQFQMGVPTQRPEPPGYPQYPWFPQQPQQQQQQPRQGAPMSVPVSGPMRYGAYPMGQPSGQPLAQPPLTSSGIPPPQQQQQQQQRMFHPDQRFNHPNPINTNVRFMPQPMGPHQSLSPWQQQQFPPASSGAQLPPPGSRHSTPVFTQPAPPPPPQQQQQHNYGPRDSGSPTETQFYRGPVPSSQSGQHSQAHLQVSSTVATTTTTTTTTDAPTTTNLNLSSHNTAALPATPSTKDLEPQYRNTTLLQPQVLTEADLEAQRREDRLRASYSTTGGLPMARSDRRSQLPVTGAVVTGVAPAVVGPLSSTSSSSMPLSSPVPLDSHPKSGDLKTSGKLSSTGNQPEPLSDPLVLNRFIAATENFLTWLNDVSCANGGVRLEEAWSKLTSIASDFSDTGRRPTQAAALCCPGRNRLQHHVPYDNNRVVLTSATNDYINASHIDFSEDWAPRYIISQAPMPKMLFDYWTMMMEQGCEVVVLLLPPNRRPNSPSKLLFTSGQDQSEGLYGDPCDPSHVPAHLPANKVGSRFCLPDNTLEIRLQAYKEASETDACGSWAERILTLRNLKTDQTRTLVHLTYQGPLLSTGDSAAFSSVPQESGITGQAPSASAIIDRFHDFVQHVHMFYRQQRTLSRPMAITCEFGAGLSGIFVTASVGILHLERLGRLADLVDLAGRLCKRRRGALQEAKQLVIAARVVGQAAVEMAAKREVAVGPRRQHTSAKPVTTPDTMVRPAEVRGKPPAAGEPVDALFSEQAVGFETLLSVVDKLTVESVERTQNEGALVDELAGRKEELVEPVQDGQIPAGQCKGSEHTTAASPPSTVKTQDQSSLADVGKNPLYDVEHLVNLSNLTANVKAGAQYSVHTPSKDDPFALLDPISNTFK